MFWIEESLPNNINNKNIRNLKLLKWIKIFQDQYLNDKPA